MAANARPPISYPTPPAATTREHAVRKAKPPRSIRFQGQVAALRWARPEASASDRELPVGTTKQQTGECYYSAAGAARTTVACLAADEGGMHDLTSLRFHGEGSPAYPLLAQRDVVRDLSVLL
ncbi:hypothetical protein HPB50_001760 [Hyalomma asiaticum]|uniref:Uncharacterized protein n=1 Tax=Hyalomma asiaticum TaxID=266040 RepID=A0ACB7T7G2_HYAAI|nr:hypothetical protein HPB50_001760 [Hyalomma asiaticum]